MPELTLVQRRINYALDSISQLKTDGHYGKYVSYVKALPATIHANTLGQAAATLKAQAKDMPTDPHQILYNQISTWLCGNFPEMPYPGGEDLLAALTANGQEEYFRAQTEALAMLEWLKKFAGAFLDEEGRD